MPSRSPSATPASVERLLDDGHDDLEVPARGQLRHDAAVRRVDVVLRGHHVDSTRRPSATTAAAVSSHERLDAEHDLAHYVLSVPKFRARVSENTRGDVIPGAAAPGRHRLRT